MRYRSPNSHIVKLGWKRTCGGLSLYARHRFRVEASDLGPSGRFRSNFGERERTIPKEIQTLLAFRQMHEFFCGEFNLDLNVVPHPSNGDVFFHGRSVAPHDVRCTVSQRTY